VRKKYEERIKYIIFNWGYFNKILINRKIFNIII
jgi:hypothetical protein